MLGLNAVFLQNFIQRFTGRDVRFEPDDFLVGERFKPHGFQLGERMLRVADEHERVFAECDDFNFWILDRIRDEAEVDDVARHVLVNLVGAAIFDVDVDRRITLHEPFDIRGQVVQTDAVDRCDADGAGNNVLQFRELVVQRLVGLDDLLAVIVKHLAFAREPEFFLAALDK